MIRIRCWLRGHLWGPEPVVPRLDRAPVHQCVRCGVTGLSADRRRGGPWRALVRSSLGELALVGAGVVLTCWLVLSIIAP